MNSSRSLKSTRKAVAVLAALLSTVATGAVAQELTLPAANSAEQVIQQNLDPQETGQGLGTVAAPIELPKNASLGDANERVKAMAAEANERLDRLVDGALSNEAGKSTVEEMSSSQLRIMQLEKKLEEAKLVAEYWETVNGKDHRAEEKIKDLELEKSDMQRELSRLREMVSKHAAERSKATPDPDPVVAEITGAAGSFRAKILIPYMGEVKDATAGETLPNGQKITSISGRGVKVTRADGSTVMLGFGTEVPLARPQHSAGVGVPPSVSQ
mgnify:CR=1 FL=1|jgi:Type IV pilus biogenesis.